MLGSRTRIYTPEGYERICKLKPNDEVIAWDRHKIRITKIQQIIKHNYELTDLYKFHFEHADRRVTVSKDHIFWLGGQHTSIADNTKFKTKVMGIDQKKVKIIGKEAVINESQIQKLERTEEGYVIMYELKLYDNKSMYFYSSEKIVTYSQGMVN
ncbi:MAG: hypothetical protein CBD03_05035 [Rhizobiales bacterium TMED143]|nr:MAG: hypothetical protein CBD03_05035 [Rhizobiales bacterium TMED143]